MADRNRSAAAPRRSRSERRPQPDAPRRVAFDLLRAVDERDAYANLTMPGLLAGRSMSGRDAAFATELGYGTLRGRGTYDAVLAVCVDRPLDVVDASVLDVLRLGVHQLLAMRVPSHAAVGATVELARAVLGEGRAKFVNAVLRKVSADDLAGWVARVAPPYDEDPLGNLAVTHSHPRWIVSAFRDALGGSLDATAQLLAADNAAPTVTLVARPGRSTVDELVAAGADPTRWSPFGAVLPGGDPGDIAAVREGRAAVQDEGSQLVAMALTRAAIDGSDERWLDLCAGPGGKAGLLGAVARARGARLVANELSGTRAALVRRTTGGDADVVVSDGRTPPWADAAFDRVLVDAPCTGLGALRRRPEARWRRRPDDLPGLRALQHDLLVSGLRSARPGGVVAYATCSPHLAETRVVVDDVLRNEGVVRGGGAERLDARELYPGVPDLGNGPDVQLWPHVHGTDAMFLSVLRKLP